MDTSKTSGKSGRLAGSLQITHGTNLGAKDQTQSKTKVEGPKVATPINEGPQSLNVDSRVKLEGQNSRVKLEGETRG
jgi:hypothetical protein